MPSDGSSTMYNVRYFILNATWYGVPQERWRIFFVGLRSDWALSRPHGPIQDPSRSVKSFRRVRRLPDDPRMLWGAKSGVPETLPSVTVWDAIGDLPRLAGHLGWPQAERSSAGAAAASVGVGERIA